LAAAIGSVVDGRWVVTAGGTAGGLVELSSCCVPSETCAFGLHLMLLVR